VVAPGFIDAHSHGDYMLPFLPTADSKIAQGITLEVVGNCGTSIAHALILPRAHQELARHLPIL
jgi:N-acyl-D-amino-acid deacylase